MKKTWKLAFAAFALFAFTACGGEENAATESEVVDTTEGVEADMETELDAETEDTTVLEDTTVQDGVADELEEEQPPVE